MLSASFPVTQNFCRNPLRFGDLIVVPQNDVESLSLLAGTSLLDCLLLSEPAADLGLRLAVRDLVFVTMDEAAEPGRTSGKPDN
jgi:hypothetical protein